MQVKYGGPHNGHQATGEVEDNVFVLRLPMASKEAATQVMFMLEQLAEEDGVLSMVIPLPPVEGGGYRTPTHEAPRSRQ